jgi:hypothetical protein
LLRDREGFVEGNRATRNALRQVVALDEFHHQRGDALARLQAEDLRDVRMIEGGEHFGFALEWTWPIPPSPRSAVISKTPRREPGARDKPMNHR